MVDDLDEEELNRRFREKAAKVRPYAGFFDWPNKETKELGIVRTLIEAVGEPLTFVTVRPGRPDPPDAIGEMETGERVAIEVTELVDEEMVRDNIESMRKTAGMASPEYRVWDCDHLVATIEKRLRAKDSVKLQGGPFAQYLVALHTDEMMLTYADASEWLSGHTFSGLQHITDSFLLFSYDGDGYKYIRLSVSQ